MFKFLSGIDLDIKDYIMAACLVLAAICGIYAYHQGNRADVCVAQFAAHVAQVSERGAVQNAETKSENLLLQSKVQEANHENEHARNSLLAYAHRMLDLATRASSGKLPGVTAKAGSTKTANPERTCSGAVGEYFTEMEGIRREIAELAISQTGDTVDLNSSKKWNTTLEK